jgi:uncharacterized protein YjbI with pentapeptide repeats
MSLEGLTTSSDAYMTYSDEFPMNLPQGPARKLFTGVRGTDFLRASHLHYADLRGADLSGADLSDTLLRDADMRGANVSNVGGITNEQLEQQAASLEGATMPDGSEHP